MAASILKIGISRNSNCDNLVGFPKSGHIAILLNLIFSNVHIEVVETVATIAICCHKN